MPRYAPARAEDGRFPYVVELDQQPTNPSLRPLVQRRIVWLTVDEAKRVRYRHAKMRRATPADLDGAR